MKKSFQYALIQILFVVSFLFSPTLVRAQNTVPLADHYDVVSQECVPFDFIFVLDQSASSDRTDPGNIRSSTVQLLIKLLADDRLYHCNKTVHRVAIVGWDGQVALELTPINFDIKSGVSAAGSFISNIYDKTASISTNSRDYLPGLHSASEIIKHSGKDTQQRQQVIFMVGGNGGIPCAVNGECAYFALDEFFGSQLSEQIEADILTLPTPTPKLFAINLPIDTPDYANRYSQKLEQIFAAYEGEAITVERDVDLAREAYRFFQDVYPHPLINEVASGTIYVDPFIQQLNLYIIRPEETAQTRFTQPAGDDFSAVPDAKYDLFLHTSVSHPKPGEWSVESESGTLIYYEQIRAITVRSQISDVKNGVLPEANLPQYNEPGEENDPNQPYFLSFALVDQFGELFIDDADYAGNATLQVIRPDGTQYELICPFDQEHYQCPKPLPVNNVGNYQWKLKFEAPSADPQNVGDYQIAAIEGSYNVMAVEPVKIIIDEPQDDKTRLHTVQFPYPQEFQPIQVTASLTTINDQILPAEKVIASNPNESIQAILTHKETGANERIYLQQSIKNPGSFTGEIGKGVVDPGDYQLEVIISGTVNPIFRQARIPAVVEFSRKDDLLSNPLTYFILYTTLAILVGMGIAWLIYSHTNSMEGSLEFYRPNGEEPFETVIMEKWLRRKVTRPFKAQPEVSPILWHLEKVTGTKDKQDLFATLTFKYGNGQEEIVKIRPHKNHVVDQSNVDELKDTVSEHELQGAIKVRYLPKNG